MIVVTALTGKTGRHIIRALLHSGSYAGYIRRELA